MSSKLISELVCQRCLRYFSHYDRLELADNIKLSRPALLHHEHSCSLRYSKCVPGQTEPVVYCIDPDAPMAERRRAFYTAVTMHASEEVPGDLIGWYSDRKPEVYAFLPAAQEQIRGFIIVEKRAAVAFKRSAEEWVPVEKKLSQHWCIDKIWIYEPHRRKGIASAAVRAIARYFGENVENLAWLCRLTDGGLALACALSGDVVHLTA